MAPQVGKSLVALLGVTGLLGVGLLATRGLDDTGATSAVAAVLSSGSTPSASTPAVDAVTDIAENTRQCALMSFDQISTVTGGVVGYDPDPAAFEGDVCRWKISGSQKVPAGTLLSLSETRDLSARTFRTYAAAAVKSGRAQRVKGLGEPAIVNRAGELEVYSAGSSYRIGFDIPDSRPPAQEIKALQIELVQVFVQSGTGA
ncbi:hypothetical protein [Kineosporia sp. NBRC 101731]|uniref:hypothetical protein n=1 Tax=Kineosporia sp. NBRC 101731 TaxID=3032199 RepID=UPI0024A2C02B|nr:hypothetical protein [Kineosporia sp. NBRC 101731]GLY29442.1 hypothetical protein Kisp02_28070 [Kineosporia sp. NBRC 101731]